MFILLNPNFILYNCFLKTFWLTNNSFFVYLLLACNYSKVVCSLLFDWHFRLHVLLPIYNISICMLTFCWLILTKLTVLLYYFVKCLLLVELYFALHVDFWWTNILLYMFIFGGPNIGKKSYFSLLDLELVMYVYYNLTNHLICYIFFVCLIVVHYNSFYIWPLSNQLIDISNCVSYLFFYLACQLLIKYLYYMY